MKNTFLVAFMLLCTIAGAQTFIRSELPTPLSTPWEIQYGPDGFLWISESGGRISRVDPLNGNKTVVYGNEATVILPATKIKALVTKTKYIIRESENDGHGVIPAHYVVPSIADIISNKDIVKEVALSLILKEK